MVQTLFSASSLFAVVLFVLVLVNLLFSLLNFPFQDFFCFDDDLAECFESNLTSGVGGALFEELLSDITIIDLAALPIRRR